MRALPLAGWVAQLVHFGRAYRAREARSFRPDLDTAAKIALIAGHALLNFFLVGIPAAVLIPNLLSARTRANATDERAAAQSASTSAVAGQLDGPLRTGRRLHLP